MTALLEISHVGASSVDEVNGVLKHVKILGRESKNGRVYSDQAMKDAAKLYEGREVNVDHPDRSRPTSERRVADGFGWLESVSVEPDGVYGDLHYLKEHAVAGLVIEAAKRNPNRFGLSHNAAGKVARKDGKNVVESIESVHSVDLVQSPATNVGLFESQGMTVQDVFEQHAPELGKLLEDAALLPPEPMPMAGPEMGEDGPEEDPQAKVKCAVVALLTAALDTKGDARAVVMKIMDTAKTLLSGLPDPMAAEDPNADPNAPPGEEGQPSGDAPPGQKPPDGQSPDQPPANDPTKTSEPAADQTAGQTTQAEDSANPFAKRKTKMAESTAPKTVDEKIALLESKIAEYEDKLAEIELKESCEKLLRDAKREVTEVRVEALKGMKDDDARKALIETWEQLYEAAPSPVRGRPNSSPAKYGSESKFPTEHKSFLAAIR